MHYLRKIWHMGGVFLLFLVYRFLSEELAIYVFGALFVFALSVDVIRLRSTFVNDLIMMFFKPLMRSNEVHSYAGTTFLMAGVLVSALVFPKVIVSLTLLFLAFADPLASFVGIKYGKDKIFGHKSIQGFVTAFLVCTLIAMTYFYIRGVFGIRTFAVSLLSGLVGAVAELLPIGKIDDNLTLPLLSSLGLFILFYFFGLL